MFKVIKHSEWRMGCLGCNLSQSLLVQHSKPACKNIEQVVIRKFSMHYLSSGVEQKLQNGWILLRSEILNKKLQ